MSTTKQIRLLISPTGMGAFICVCAAFTIIFFSSFLPVINNYFVPAGASLNKILSGQWHSGLSLIGKIPLINSAAYYLLWAGVGALCYCLVWIVFSAANAAHNDFVIGTKYVHGRQSKLYWFQFTERFLLRLSAALLILALTELSINFWYPTSTFIMNRWTHSFTDVSYLLDAVIVFIGWLLIFHIYIILLRLVLLRLRITGYALDE